MRFHSCRRPSLSIPEGHQQPSATFDRRTRIAALVVLAAVVVSACGAATEAVVAQAGDLRHIHDFALDEDGTLLAASHTGLYRIEDLDRAVLVGTEQHDLMAMTQNDTGELTASGHPDLRLEEYRVEGKEPHLGIIESLNMGRTWAKRGMLGDADFHAFAPAVDGMYAAESTSARIWYGDLDGQWKPRGEADLNDLAVDPANPGRVIGTDLDGGLWLSNNGAETWDQQNANIAPIEVEWPIDTTLFAVDRSGRFWRADDPAGPWTQTASGPEAEPETFWIDRAGTWWLSTHGGDIWGSDDTGANWTQIYRSES